MAEGTSYQQLLAVQCRENGGQYPSINGYKNFKFAAAEFTFGTRFTQRHREIFILQNLLYERHKGAFSPFRFYDITRTPYRQTSALG